MYNTHPQSILFNCYIYFPAWIWTHDLFNQFPIIGWIFGSLLCYNKHLCMGFVVQLNNSIYQILAPSPTFISQTIPQFSNIN